VIEILNMIFPFNVRVVINVNYRPSKIKIEASINTLTRMHLPYKSDIIDMEACQRE